MRLDKAMEIARKVLRELYDFADRHPSRREEIEKLAGATLAEIHDAYKTLGEYLDTAADVEKLGETLDEILKLMEKIVIAMQRLDERMKNLEEALEKRGEDAQPQDEYSQMDISDREIEEIKKQFAPSASKKSGQGGATRRWYYRRGGWQRRPYAGGYPRRGYGGGGGRSARRY